MNMKLPSFIILLSSAFLAFSVQSAVIISGTRIIYPEKDKEVSIKMTNNGKSPVLIQSWIDSGDPKSRPDNAQAPFTLTPPINRVDPGKGQSLRIRYTGEALPQDKESIFYLNVLEIPARVNNTEGKNVLQMAFRSRLKLFFPPIRLINSRQRCTAANEMGTKWHHDNGHQPNALLYQYCLLLRRSRR